MSDVSTQNKDMNKSKKKKYCKKLFICIQLMVFQSSVIGIKIIYYAIFKSQKYFFYNKLLKYILKICWLMKGTY